MAAGLGFKTFTTGEVLTAADVNGYLMQGILVFANAAARSSAITSPQEGQYSFLKDTNALEYYDGAAWVGAPVGDITSVTAGTGISGGGSSGDVTITNSMATAIDAKGDLIAGTADNTFSRLAVGTTKNQTLIVDSTTSTGLKWGNTPALGGMTLLNAGGTALTGAATIRITGLSNLSRLVVLVAGGSSANASSYISIRFNNDSTANYGYAGLASVNGVLTTAYSASGTGIPFARQGNNAADAWSGLVNVDGCYDTGMYQVYVGSTAAGAGTAEGYAWSTGFYNGGQALTSVDILSSTGNFDLGTIYVFGA